MPGERLGRAPQFLVLSRTARPAVWSGAVWGAVFAIYVAASALGYASTYPTAAQRRQLAVTFGSNAGLNAILGPAQHIDTVSGFVAWRCLGILGLLAAVWGLLTASRLLRGEEEAGRWDLLLVGATTRRRAAIQGVGGLLAGAAVLWTCTAGTAVLIGHTGRAPIPAVSALLISTTIVAVALCFQAVAALASQLAPTRRQAATWAGASLGVAYTLRMVADSTSLAWLRWLTPLGWAELVRPVENPRPLPLLLLVIAMTGFSCAAVFLAGRRDAGASVIRDRAPARPRLALLGGQRALSLRLVRPTVLGWLAAAATLSFVIGLVSRTAGEALAQAPGFAKAFGRLGGRGSGAAAYLSVSFLIVAAVIALLASGQVVAAREEEESGRLDLVLTRPVSRATWLVGRLEWASAAVTLAGLVAGSAAWLGAIAGGAQVTGVALLQAGLNTVPPALFVLGAGVLGLGVWPRHARAAGVAVVSWSFLVAILGGVLHADHWLMDTSVFHHMSASPVVAPDWTSAAALVAVGGVLAAGGVLAMSRRDIEAE